MTPSPPAQAEASETVEKLVERLIPDKGCSCNQGRLERLGYHDEWCPMHYRPAVAAALQSERAIARSRAERIVAMHAQLQSERDSRDRRIAELEDVVKEIWRLSLVIESAVRNSDKPNLPDINALIWSARSALTPGEKS